MRLRDLINDFLDLQRIEEGSFRLELEPVALAELLREQASLPAEAVAMWMASPGYRRNILDPAWRVVGVSAVLAMAAAGPFGNQDVTLLVTDFGVRS